MKCGTLLYRRRKSDRYRKTKISAVLAVLLLCAIGFAGLFQKTARPPVEIMEAVSDLEGNEEEKEQLARQKKLEAKLRAAMQEKMPIQEAEKNNTAKIEEALSEDLIKEKEIVAGWVIIVDPWGRLVTKVRTGLAGNGWLALPANACLGGNRWHFYPDSGQETEISGGLWIYGDKAGLWHLAENADAVQAPELAAWDEGGPVSWTSLDSDNAYDSIILSPGRTEGFFTAVPLPDYIDESGLFVQNKKIVGWSFGQWEQKGYMWQGQAGQDLAYKTWVKYFYNITFAGGREEKFAMALAMKKSATGLEQLAAFVDGFALEPKLSLEDTPTYLLPEGIIKDMRVLLTDAIRSGEGSEVVAMFNSDILKRTGDITLLIDVIPVIASVQGYYAAVAEIEDSGRYITRLLGRDVPALNALHLHLYQDWLESLVSANGADEGWQVYAMVKQYYPDDPYVHLLGVELVLMNGDWEEAERLLYMKNYPPAFQDRYQLLARRISDMKGQLEKIIIRFPGGSSRIPVSAAVNETLNQKFIVDTGASMVTIPSTTAEKLGLKILGQRTLSTASGVETVDEVIIEAIEIDGWIEYDIRAVVLDMPDRPGLGLLGLNYLGRFHMDLKTDEGTLYLSPR